MLDEKAWFLLLFTSKVFHQVDVRTLCMPVKFFHTKLPKLFPQRSVHEVIQKLLKHADFLSLGLKKISHTVIMHVVC